MPDIRLVAEVGRPTGSRAANRLRAEGKIPAVLYGHGAEPLPLTVNGRELRHALTGEAGVHAVLTLAIDGREQMALAKAIQRHPVRGTVTHVDFLAVSRDEVITVDVPIALVGEATQVLKNDGVVDQPLTSLTIHTTPARIPVHIEADVSGLAIGDTIRVGDLKLPAGVKTDVDPEEAVVVGQPPQVTEEMLVPEGAVVEEEAAAEPGEAKEEGTEQAEAQAAKAEAAAADASTGETPVGETGGEG